MEERSEVRSVQVGGVEVTFTVRQEETGACVQGVLIASDGQWTGTVLDGLDAYARVADFDDSELEDMYRTARHLRSDLEE